jgi:hypothetical protein
MASAIHLQLVEAKQRRACRDLLRGVSDWIGGAFAGALD